MSKFKAIFFCEFILPNRLFDRVEQVYPDFSVSMERCIKAPSNKNLSRKKWNFPLETAMHRQNIAHKHKYFDGDSNLMVCSMVSSFKMQQSNAFMDNLHSFVFLSVNVSFGLLCI